MCSLSRTQALTSIIMAMPKSSQIPTQAQDSVQGQEGSMFLGGGRGGVEGGTARDCQLWEKHLCGAQA